MKSNTSEQRSISNDLWGMSGLLFTLATFFPSSVMAEETSVLNSGDTAWMLTATALVLFMTIPGLPLFNAGMVRSKNVLFGSNAMLRNYITNDHFMGSLRL